MDNMDNERKLILLQSSMICLGFEETAEKLKPKVYSLLRKYASGLKYLWPDLKQQCLLGIFEAWCRYDGVRDFGGFAYVYMKYKVIKTVKDEFKHYHNLSLEALKEKGYEPSA